jgi:hypothetical protein
MSVVDLEAVVDRAQADPRFRRIVTHWSESLRTDYALSADEADALRTSNYEALIRLGLDGPHAQRATRLA